MNTYASLVVAWIGVTCLLGCASREEKANRLFAEAAHQVTLARDAESLDYAQSLQEYLSARRKLERLVLEYPSSNISAALLSGMGRIDGFNLMEFRNLEAGLCERASAEQDACSCAYIVAKGMENTQSKVQAFAAIAMLRLEMENDEYALKMLAECLGIAKGLEDDKDKLALLNLLAQCCRPEGMAMLRGAIASASPEQAHTAISSARLQIARDVLEQALVTARSIEYRPRTEWEKAWSKAVGEDSESRRIDDQYAALDKAEALAYIADEFVDARDNERALEVLDEVTQSMGGWSASAWRKAPVLTSIANTYVRAGERQRASRTLSLALAAAKASEIDFLEFDRFLDIARAYSSLGDKDQASQVLDEALGTAKSKKDGYSKFTHLATIATEYAALGRLNEAEEVLHEAAQIRDDAEADMTKINKRVVERDGTNDPISRTIALFNSNAYLLTRTFQRAVADVASAYVTIGRVDDAIRLAESTSSASVLAELATKCARGGQIDKAILLAKSSGSAEALAQVATQCAENGQIERASGIANMIGDATDRDSVFIAIAQKLAEHGRGDDAAAVAASIHDSNRVGYALLRVASGHCQAGNIDEASRQLFDALNIGFTLDADSTVQLFPWSFEFHTAGTYGGVLTAIADCYTKSGEVDHACQLLHRGSQLVATMKNGWQKGTALCDIATSYAVAGKIDEASQLLRDATLMAQQMQDATDEPDFTDEIAKAYAQIGQVDRALDMVRGHKSGTERVAFLIELASECAGTDRAEQASRALSEALQEIHKIGEPLDRVVALDKIGITYKETHAPLDLQGRKVLHAIVRDCYPLIFPSGEATLRTSR